MTAECINHDVAEILRQKDTTRQTLFSCGETRKKSRQHLLLLCFLKTPNVLPASGNRLLQVFALKVFLHRLLLKCKRTRKCLVWIRARLTDWRECSPPERIHILTFYAPSPTYLRLEGALPNFPLQQINMLLKKMKHVKYCYVVYKTAFFGPFEKNSRMKKLKTQAKNSRIRQILV